MDAWIVRKKRPRPHAPQRPVPTPGCIPSCRPTKKQRRCPKPASAPVFAFASVQAARDHIEVATQQLDVVFTGRGFQNRAQTRFYRGLRPTIRAAFFGTYHHKASKRNSSSASTGSIVDQELAHWVATGELKATGNRRKPHRFTRRVVELAETRGMLPVATQVPLVHGTVATAMDLVMLAPDGCLEQWEVKTGGDKGLHSCHHGNFAAPLQAVRNTVWNQYQLQAGWAHHVAAHLLRIQRTAIVLVNAKGVAHKPLGKFFRRPATRLHLLAAGR